MKNVFLIVTTDKYPEGDAGAVRTHAFARIFRELGYTPLVVGMGASTDFRLAEYDGVAYYSLRYSRGSFAFRALGHLLFKRRLKRIVRRLPQNEIRGILFVSGKKSVLEYLKKIGQKKSISLYYDSVEWYSPSEFPDGEKNHAYRYNDALNRQYINEQFRVFSISSYLDEHFKSRGIRSLRIPVIMDVSRIACEKQTADDHIKIVYAGAMGTKDKIANFIKALSLLDKATLRCIRMYIIGITQEQYEKVFGSIPEDVKTCIFFTGRIPRTEVLAHLREADFTMLLRPEDERYAKAGFPTKVVESLASGVPVITNLTSDLTMYLREGENAVIVNGVSVEACADALCRAVSTPFDVRQEMQLKARKTAEDCFDYRLYTERIDAFIKDF